MARFFLIALGLWLVIPELAQAGAKRAPRNKYGVEVVSSAEMYREMVKEHPRLALVEVSRHVPGVVVDLRYATTNNFMKTRLYPSDARAYLTRDAADRLLRVQERLAKDGYGLKIFDAYRPYAVTVRMWDERTVPPIYLAPPKEGSSHNRGVAVDCTLIRLDTGEEVAMPTEYDSFKKRAHADYEKLPPDVRANRDRLIAAMRKEGFKVYEWEWWHFNLTDFKRYPLLDIPFQELKR